MKAKVFLIFYLYQITLASKGFIPMKIVDEVSNVGVQQDHFAIKLVTDVQPSQYVGPDHLEKLVGRCFELLQNNYKYRVCPFHNITQHEMSSSWNAYKGVLGVWKSWKMDRNHTLKVLVFRHGDRCGDSHRKVEVTLKCSDGETEIVQVTGTCV